MFAPFGIYTNAMRLGNPLGVAPSAAASALNGGAIASSAGRAITVPKPLRKVRRGICHDLFIPSHLLYRSGLLSHCIYWRLLAASHLKRNTLNNPKH
jgi:hypothetical protein